MTAHCPHCGHPLHSDARPEPPAPIAEVVIEEMPAAALIFIACASNDAREWIGRELAALGKARWDDQDRIYWFNPFDFYNYDQVAAYLRSLVTQPVTACDEVQP